MSFLTLFSGCKKCLEKSPGLIILVLHPGELKFYKILRCGEQLNWSKVNSPASLYSAGKRVKKSTNFTNNTNIDFFSTFIITTVFAYYGDFRNEGNIYYIYKYTFQSEFSSGFSAHLCTKLTARLGPRAFIV